MKNIEEKNIDKEYLFKESQRIAKLGSYILNTSTGIWNSSDILDEIFGITKEYERSVEGWSNIVHPEHREMMDNYFAKEVVGKKLTFNKEYKIIRQNDGETLWVHGLGELKFDSSGNVIKMLGTITNITERKLIELRLKEKREEIETQNEEYKQLIEELQIAKEKIEISEEKYRNLVETSSDIIWETNTDGFYTYISPQIENILGYKQNEFIGKSPFIIMPNDEAKKISLISNEIIKSKQPFIGLENLAIHKNGSQLIFETNGVPIFDSRKNLKGYRGINRDITKRKQTELLLVQKNEEIEAQNEEYKQLNEELNIAKEKAEESDRLKSTFLANMSHEIRTPMNGIIGFSQLLLKKDLPEDKKQKFVEIINTNSYQLLGIINDIIDISKIELGLITSYLNNVNLINLLIDIETIIKPSANIKNIKLVLNKPVKDINSEIITDDIKLRQILTNLLTNAIKFTKTGKVEFGYLIKLNEIEFYVKDDGCGIPAESSSQIFERFRQLDNQPNDSRTGTGLGLAITKAFVELLGGKIWFNSELNIGTTFFFTINYNPVFAEAENKQIITENIYNWYNKTILIAEDDIINFNLIEEIFNTTNVTLIHATNGQLALELYKSNPSIDLILMDIKLPLLNGLEVTKEIRKTNSTIPIIAITAYAFSEDKEKAAKAGCSDYLAKPIKAVELKNRINKFLTR